MFLELLEAMQAPQDREKHPAHSTATSNVTPPPSTIAGTRPNQAAVNPDSNSPSSLDAPINTEFTALTRPRIASGVSSCTSRPRM